MFKNAKKPTPPRARSRSAIAGSLRPARGGPTPPAIRGDRRARVRRPTRDRTGATGSRGRSAGVRRFTRESSCILRQIDGSPHTPRQRAERRSITRDSHEVPKNHAHAHNAMAHRRATPSRDPATHLGSCPRLAAVHVHTAFTPQRPVHSVSAPLSTLGGARPDVIAGGATYAGRAPR